MTEGPRSPWPPIPDTVAGHPVATEHYLRTRWLLGATITLEKARRAAGLSVEALAQRLGTTPAVIRRCERDDGGHLSLRRYLDWLIACGQMPVEIQTYALQDVDRPQAGECNGTEAP